MALITGTANNDALLGTPEADEIRGAGGNDRIFGFEGNDTVRGGLGNDTIDGNQGNDDLDGSVGNDRISGRQDNDSIKGGEGNDTVSGNDGDDTVRGGRGQDTVSGDNGDDLVTGGGGDDFLNGGNDNDWLAGGSGNDTIQGGNDNDTINGRSGNDILIGDRLTIIPGGAASNDYIVGGTGNDILVGAGGGNLSDFQELRLDSSFQGNLNHRDTLIGGVVGVNSGAGEIDTLESSASNPDTFVLGLAADPANGLPQDEVLYDNQGVDDYALIKFFHTVNNEDTIQVVGDLDDYVLGASPVAGIDGSAISLDSNGNGTFEASDELIAILENIPPLAFGVQPDLSSVFTFV